MGQITRLADAIRAETPIKAAMALDPGDCLEYVELALEQGKEARDVAATLSALKETIPGELATEARLTDAATAESIRVSWETLFQEADRVLARKG